MLKLHSTMTKYFFCLSIAGASMAFGQSSFNFNINGTIRHVPDNHMVYIHHKWDGKNFTDSAKVKGGQFTFKGKAVEPNMYWITRENNINEQPNLIFFADPGKININGSVDSLQFASVSGGPTETDYIDYNKMMNGFGTQQQELVKMYNQAQASNDQATMMKVRNDYQALDGQVKGAVENFIKTHPKSAVSGYAIYFNYQNNPNATIEELEHLVGLLDKSILNTKYGKLGQEKLTQLRGTTVGFQATDFTQNNMEDKPVKLSDFRGKYVLVDFWASWCGPCRGENPNVVAAYNKYKDKGFTILGVSFDQNKTAWMKAVEADRLTWNHVSDLKGWGNEVGKIYGITSIPQNILVDKEGKIIAKNLRGAALEQKLEEVIK